VSSWHLNVQFSSVLFFFFFLEESTFLNGITAGNVVTLTNNKYGRKDA
jgi:hypothetical protein